MRNGSLGWIVIAALLIALLLTGYIALFRQTTVVTETAASERYFVNPMMGFAPWSSDDAIDASDTLVYVDATWAELEPEDDVFAFDAFETANDFSRWRAEGKQLVFRLCCDSPGRETHMDIPQWLYDGTGGDGCFYECAYGMGYSPNYANPLFISEHDELLTALGARYGGESFLYFIELGSVGHWGEWHVNTSEGVDALPPLSVLALYGRQYDEQFPAYRLLTRRPFSFSVDQGFGLYNDMTGDPEATRTFLDWIENGGAYYDDEDGLSACTDLWEFAPVGGEIYSHMDPADYLGEHTERTIQLLRDCHATFIGPGCPNDVPAQYAEDAERVRAAIGYRYRIVKSECTAYGALGRRQSIRLTLTNDGAAPLYEAWEIMLYYSDAAGNVKHRQHTGRFANEIMPGDTLTFSVDTDWGSADGAVRLDLVIENPRNEAAAIRWAMDSNVDMDGYYGVLYRAPAN